MKRTGMASVAVLAMAHSDSMGAQEAPAAEGSSDSEHSTSYSLTVKAIDYYKQDSGGTNWNAGITQASMAVSVATAFTGAPVLAGLSNAAVSQIASLLPSGISGWTKIKELRESDWDPQDPVNDAYLGKWLGTSIKVDLTVDETTVYQSYDGTFDPEKPFIDPNEIEWLTAQPNLAYTPTEWADKCRDLLNLDPPLPVPGSPGSRPITVRKLKAVIKLTFSFECTCPYSGGASSHTPYIPY